MRPLSSLLCAALACAPARAGEEQDRYEDQAAVRVAQHTASRGFRADQGERGSTLRDLEAAFPGKVTKTEPGKNESEGETWFALVAGGGDVWSRADATAAGLGPMFDRWRQRLELGPVPSIKRDEFLKFAKLIGNNAAAMQNQGGEVSTDKEADRVFRVLDLNGDGELTGDERSAGVRLDKSLTGRVSREQYREYFHRKVGKKAEALSAALKANEALMRNLNPDAIDRGTGLPGWFGKIDEDMDRQVSLAEWRKAGKDLEEFLDMDLNGDGLLTADEYARWGEQKREAERKRAGGE